MAKTLYAAIKMSYEAGGPDTWKADLRWGPYSVCGWGGDPYEAIGKLLENLSGLALGWLLLETATEADIALETQFAGVG